jgi:hypothetical protein
MASAAYQTKYVVHGTVDGYVLPDELLDSACSSIETALGSKVLRGSLTETEATELAVILSRLRELEKQIPFNQPSVSNSELLENPFWQDARDLARKGLGVMGSDLEECERTVDQ